MSGRRLILLMSVSLDGFVARRDGVIQWLGEDEEHGDQRHRLNLEMLGQIGLIVVGGGVYPDFVRGWSTSDSPMGQLMNSLPKVVFSQSLETVDWANARLSRRPLEEEIPELKREGGKDMVVFGGARIAHSLIRLGLFDELRLTVHPVALGDGLPLMHGLPEPQRFTLVSSTAYADGCVTQAWAARVMAARSGRLGSRRVGGRLSEGGWSACGVRRGAGRVAGSRCGFAAIYAANPHLDRRDVSPPAYIRRIDLSTRQNPDARPPSPSPSRPPTPRSPRTARAERQARRAAAI